jgi:endonuclease/exonuclease/phosphatase family metal-dependent hydrolase
MLYFVFSCIQANPRCRDSQLFEVLQFVEQTRGVDPIILVGDFNTKPRHTAYSLLTRCLGLRDVFEADPVDTCDLTSNIFTDRKRMTPKRIDFILYSDEFATSHTIQLKVR